MKNELTLDERARRFLTGVYPDDSDDSDINDDLRILAKFAAKLLDSTPVSHDCLLREPGWKWDGADMYCNGRHTVENEFNGWHINGNYIDTHVTMGQIRSLIYAHECTE